MILRFSQKLGSRLKTGTLTPLPMDAAPIADWTSHLFFFDRTPYTSMVLLASASSASNQRLVPQLIEALS